MARFTANGGLRLHLHGERSVFGGEPKEPIKFRVCGERYLKNPVRVRGKDRGGWRQGLFRVSTAVKKAGNYKVGETLKREGFDDTDVEEEDEEDEEEDEFGVDELACFRGLVLDVSYRPVNVVCWKRAICLEFLEKADVLEYYDQTVSSAQGSFYIPAVLRVPHLLQAMKRRRIKHSLSRKSIFYRDSYTCQRRGRIGKIMLQQDFGALKGQQAEIDGWWSCLEDSTCKSYTVLLVRTVLLTMSYQFQEVVNGNGTIWSQLAQDATQGKVINPLKKQT